MKKFFTKIKHIFTRPDSANDFYNKQLDSALGAIDEKDYTRAEIFAAFEKGNRYARGEGGVKEDELTFVRIRAGASTVPGRFSRMFDYFSSREAKYQRKQKIKRMFSKFYFALIDLFKKILRCLKITKQRGIKK